MTKTKTQNTGMSFIGLLQGVPPGARICIVDVGKSVIQFNAHPRRLQAPARTLAASSKRRPESL